MPIYEFRCGDCGQIFDRLLGVDTAEPPCPECGGAEVRRLISLIGGLGGASTEIASAPSAGCGGCGGACACAN